MSEWTNTIERALLNLGGVAPLSEIYDEIEKIRSDLGITWKSTVRERIQRHSSDAHAYNKSNPDLFYSVEGIGSGIWGIRSALKLSPVAVDIHSDETTIRIKQETYRILRDTELVRKLKQLHSYKCQICSDRIELPDGSFYSEGHHIQPLGKPHNGPDVPGNIIILCPNHHAMCDLGAIKFADIVLKTSSGHTVEQKYMQYNDDVIYKNT